MFMDDLRSIFSTRLKEAFEKSNDVSQSSAAKTLGVARNTVNRWVSGESWPEPNVIDELAIMLNVRPQWLMGAEEISINESIKLKIRNKIELTENSEALQAALKSLHITNESKLNKLVFILDSMLKDEDESNQTANAKKEA
jgi:transcriptional regulator with XRE-family HTH domain